MRLESNIEAHLDFGRTNTTSLTVSKIEEGNAEEWVKTYQENTVELGIRKEEYKIAKANYKILFGKTKKTVDINEINTDTDITKEGNMDEQV